MDDFTGGPLICPLETLSLVFFAGEGKGGNFDLIEKEASKLNSRKGQEPRRKVS